MASNEFSKPDEVIEERRKLIKNQGFWVCDKCGTKYYAGINCDICLEEDFKREMKELLSNAD